ncbi:MAG: HDOD domain-containing protein [Burkholderiaceae bacterium]|nr:HDOD domain-containing protein [Burkholderiaceae bacterium]
MDLASLLALPNALPSAPQAVARLIKTIDNRNASIDAIIECIEIDPVVVAKLLRLVNSPFFFRGRAIDNVGDAVRLLGLVQVRSLVLGLVAKERFPSLPPAQLDEFWRFSLSTAELARHLSRKADVDTEAVYTAALLHMIGALVMRISITEKMLSIDRICPSMAIGRGEAEQQVLGYCYADVGAALARQWELPGRIVRVIETQRTPDFGKDGALDASAVLLASWRVRAIGMKLSQDAQVRLCTLPIIKAFKALNVEPLSLMQWEPVPDDGLPF